MLQAQAGADSRRQSVTFITMYYFLNDALDFVDEFLFGVVKGWWIGDAPFELSGGYAF